MLFKKMNFYFYFWKKQAQGITGKPFKLQLRMLYSEGALCA